MIWVVWYKAWFQGIFAVAAVVLVSQHKQVGTQDGDEKFSTNPKPRDFQRHCTCFSGHCMKHSLKGTEGLDLLLLAQDMCCTLTRWVLPINHMQVTYFCLCSRGMRSLSLVMYGWCFLAACSWNIAKSEHFTEMSLLRWHSVQQNTVTTSEFLRGFHKVGFFLRFKATWVILLSSGERKLWWQSPPQDYSFIWAWCVVADFLREPVNQWGSHTSDVLSIFLQLWGLYCCQTPLRGVLNGIMALSITGHRCNFSGCGENNLPW